MEGSTHYRNLVDDTGKACRVTTLDCGTGPHRPAQDEVTVCEHGAVERMLKSVCQDKIQAVAIPAMLQKQSVGSEQGLAHAYEVLAMRGLKSFRTSALRPGSD